jgi:hypothetical protein
MLAGFAWHCMTLSVALLRELGSFDENFYPGYWGDNDYCYRAILAGHMLAGPDAIPTLEGLGDGPASGKAIRSGRIYADGSEKRDNFEKMADYYRRKWGGDASAETFSTPFDLPVPTSWWSPAYV